MKKTLLIVAGVLLVGALALAQNVQQLDLNISRRISAITSGLLLVPANLIGSNSDVEKNRITRSLVADISYDFAASTIVCTDTPAVTLTGAQAGDPCIVGIGPRDGGTPIVTANSAFSCFAQNNSVILRHCAVGTAANPVDAGYTVRVISSN